MRRLQSVFRRLFRRAEIERQMADELAFHIDARATDLMSRLGVSREEAIRQARIEFGSVEKYKEEGRASLGLRLIGNREDSDDPTGHGYDYGRPSLAVEVVDS